jgi:hypothetical protein
VLVPRLLTVWHSCSRGDVVAFVGFCGSRLLPSASFPLITSVVASVLHSGRRVAVGCASGADLAVRLAAPRARVFHASSFPDLPPTAALVARSSSLVSFVAHSGSGAAFVGFVSSGPCPDGLRPSASSSACFAGFGSGSWASLAFAAGLRVPVLVFPIGWSPSLLPASWGSWAPAAGFGAYPSGPWASAWRFIPPVAQAALW